MEQVLELLSQAWAWLEAQGLAGDVIQWIVGTVTGIPIVGGVIAAIVGVFSKTGAYKLGEKWGLILSAFMRKIPGIGKLWELFEDRVLGAVADLFNGIKVGANQDDKK